MSYDFAANSRYMQGPITTQRNSVGLSIVMWVNCTAAQWASTSQQYGAWIANDATSSNDNSLRLTKTNGAADRVSATGRTSSDGSASETFADTTWDALWVPVIGTFTNDSLRNVYIGSTTAIGTNTSTKAVGSALDTIRIGSAANGFSNFGGLIAEVAFYDKVLSDAEINSFRTGAETGPAPNTIATANCFAYYPLDTDSATQTNEGSDATGDLTVTNAVYSADHPTITASSSIAPIAHHHYQHNTG